MARLVFVKWGGSLITDKRRPETPRPDVIRRLAQEVRAAMAQDPSLRVLLGHGSGSFGHVVARQYGVREGVHGPHGWEGFARTAAAAARLNRIVTDICLEEGLLVVPLPPSATAWCEDGVLMSLDTRPHRVLLQHGLIPLVYGDVALDGVRGGTIVSTEEVFAFLVRQEPALRPGRILLVGEVDGVYTRDPKRDPDARLIPFLTPEAALSQDGLGGSWATDVTGGMAAKVREMARLVQEFPHIRVHIFSGLEAGNLTRALLDPEAAAGTCLAVR